TIAPGGWLDVEDNDLVVLGGQSSSEGVANDIRQMVFDGRLRTLAPESVPGHTAALAPLDNRLLHLTSWSNVPISDGADFGQVIVKYTYSGDTNLDNQVDQQ